MFYVLRVIQTSLASQASTVPALGWITDVFLLVPSLPLVACSDSGGYFSSVDVDPKVAKDVSTGCCLLVGSLSLRVGLEDTEFGTGFLELGISFYVGLQV